MYNFFHRLYHHKYHGTYHHAKKLFVFDLMLLALSFLMLGGSIFFFFWKPGITDLIDLSISLGNERIKSGEEVHLTVNYVNRSKFNLNSVTLGMHLPEGFVVDRNRAPESVFSKNSTFDLKQLAPGAKGQMELFGIFWAEPGAQEKIIALLAYNPESTNRTEQKLASFIASLPESVLEGSLSVAEKSFPNQPLTFTYKLKNNGSEKIDGVNLTHNWTPGVSSLESIKNFSMLPGEEKVFRGEITPSSANKNVKFNITPQVPINNKKISQGGIEKNITIIFPDLNSSVRLLSSIPYVEPGQTIPINVWWKNDGSFTIKDLLLHISAEPNGVVDWPATARENHFKAEKNGLTINSSQRTALAGAKPGAEDSFSMQVKLLPHFSLGQTEKIPLVFKPSLEANLTEVAGQKLITQGSTLSIPLSTELTLSAETRYFTTEGDQLGRGSLPPTVGDTTKYWIFVEVNNTTNEVVDAKFNAILPNTVQFTGKQSVTIGPELRFNSTSRAVSWQYNSLPANSRTGLYFEVAVTPNPDQIGNNIQLVNSLSFFAKDDVVEKQFNLIKGHLNNVLKNNDRGSRSGSAVVAE